MSITIIVTGASGFIGRALCAQLQKQGHGVLAAVRIAAYCLREGRAVVLPVLGEDTHWKQALAGKEVFIHLAARVHVMRDTAADPLAAYREANVNHTLELATQAAAVGVRRFVFVSSVKVNGEANLADKPFTEDAFAAPQDPYAVSKWEAEQGLRQIATSTGMEVVIIRPPLVYGPGVKANFAALMRAVQRGAPLPLGAVHNLRSLVGLDNLVDFIITCAHHPSAANQTFLVSDGADTSTPDLVRAMARAAGRPARLFPVPVPVLASFGSLLGKRAAVDRLCSSLQLDISKARKLLQWSPPLTLDEGLRRAFAGSSK